MNFNLTGTGDFNVQDNGTTRFQVLDNGRIEMSGTTDASGTTNSGILEIANSLRIDGNEIITNTNTSLLLQNDNNGDLMVDNGSLFVDASANSVGVNTTTPGESLDVEGNLVIHNGSPYLHLSVNDESDGKIRFSDDAAAATQNFEIAFNADDQDLHIRSDDNSGADIIRIHNDGNVEMDQGWLAVGANPSSITRYGVYEMTWPGSVSFNDDGYRYYNIGNFNYPTTGLPGSVTVTKIVWGMDGYHEDANENHGVWIHFGGGNAAPWYGWRGNAGNGAKDIDWHYVSSALTTNQNRGAIIRMRVEDEDCWFCGSDDMRVFNMNIKIYYRYNQGLQRGDIAAQGRVYANSNTDVGDMAEYFEVNKDENIEPGKIVVLDTEGDNRYRFSNKPYEQNIVGVISENPSIVLNNPSVGPPVALAGRVKVKLQKSNQLIKPGQFLTTAADGFAILATEMGPVIGYAVTSQKVGEDFVEILVQPGRFYYPKKERKEYNTNENNGHSKSRN